MDERKAKKALGAIQLILEKKTLDELVKNYVFLHETKKRLREEHKDELKNIGDLEEKLEKIKAEIDVLKREMNIKEKNIDELREKMLMLKGDLEKRLEKIANEPVEVIIPSLDSKLS